MDLAYVNPSKSSTLFNPRSLADVDVAFFKVHGPKSITPQY